MLPFVHCTILNLDFPIFLKKIRNAVLNAIGLFILIYSFKPNRIITENNIS